jgi:hypothetical protein
MACDIIGKCTQYTHALNAWDLNFQVCLRYTLTPAPLERYRFYRRLWAVSFTHRNLIFSNILAKLEVFLYRLFRGNQLLSKF